MKTAEQFYNQFQQALPQKMAFTGRKQEAIDTQTGSIKDLNQDGKTNIADALLDGSLTQREYSALKEQELTGLSAEDRLEPCREFDQGLARFLQNKPELKFASPLQDLAKSSSQHELRFYDVNATGDYDKVDLVTSQLNVHVVDKDGFYVDSKEDLAVTLNGEANLGFKLPESLPLPSLVKASASGQKITFSLMGFYEIFALGLHQNKDQGVVVITPPSQKLINTAKSLGVDIPKFSPELVGKLLGVDQAFVQEKDGKFQVALLPLLDSKFPQGIEVAGKKICPNDLDVTGMSFKDAKLADNKLALTLSFDKTKLALGTGSEPTKGEINETLELDLALTDITLGQNQPFLGNLSTINISLSNLTEHLKSAINNAAKGNLKDLNIQFKGNQINISAQVNGAPVKFNLPISIKNTTLNLDLSQIKLLGLPVTRAAERIQQYLANTSNLQTKLAGQSIEFNLDEILAKQAPEIGKTHRIETASLDNGTLKVLLTKNSRDAKLMEPPTKQPPHHPRHEIKPFAAYETKGSGVVGVTYSYSLPLGQSPLGKIFKAKDDLGQVPNVSYTYLDNTYNASASVGTDGTVRVEGSTGVRVSANPFGMPVYAQIDPVGVGIKAGSEGVHPYIPTKIELGYDNGKVKAGAFYQHNTVIAGKDDNLVGVSGGVRW